MSRRMPVFYAPGYVSQNLGDWLIVRELLRGFADRSCDVICRDARMGQYGIPGVRACGTGAEFFLRLAAACLRAHSGRSRGVWLMAPGHHFSCKDKKLGALRHALRRLGHILLRACGVRIARLGVSVGPLTPADGKFEKILASGMEWCTVRDRRSAEFLKSLGIAEPRLLGDLSFLAGFFGSSRSGSSRHIVVSFRERLFGEYAANRYGETVVEAVEDVMSACCSEGSREITVVHQVEEDEDLSRRLHDRLKRLGAVRIERRLDWAGAQEVYGRADVVLSNRLHVLLIAALGGALPVALIRPDAHDKIAGLFEDAGWRGLIIDIDSPGRAAQFSAILRESGEWPARVRAHVAGERARILEFLDAICAGDH